MKTKDLWTIFTVALGTATLTMATFWGDTIEAGSEANTLAAVIAKPKLVSHGVEMTLTPAGKRVFKAGDEPVFELTAVNTTALPASVSVGATMDSFSPVDITSRVVSRPSVLWRQEQILTLKPNETKVVTLTAKTKLPANCFIGVSLRELEPSGKATPAGPIEPAALQLAQPSQSSHSEIVAMSFSTATRGKHAVLVSSR